MRSLKYARWSMALGVMVFLCIGHIALPCTTNSLQLANRTGTGWNVELSVCGEMVWTGIVQPHRKQTAGFEMQCGESAISVRVRAGSGLSPKSLKGAFGYLQPHIPDEGTVFIEPTGLRYAPDPHPSLFKLALAQIFGATRCWAG